MICLKVGPVYKLLARCNAVKKGQKKSNGDYPHYLRFFKFLSWNTETNYAIE